MRHGGAGSCWLDHAHHRRPWWGCVGRTSRSVPVPRWSRGGHHQHHHQNPPRSRRQWGWVWRGYCLDFGVGTWLDGRGGERCGLEPRGALVCGREGGSEGVSVSVCVRGWGCECEGVWSECMSVWAEEVGHDFRGMCILLSRIIRNVLFLLTQRVDLGCVGVHCSLWQMRSD